MNIGTVLRYVFGSTLRQEFLENPDTFDRLTLFKKPLQNLENKAFEIISELS